MLNIAHRGARSAAPENTLEAIAKAGQLGADAVEIDVQLGADGVAIVFHDDDLLRCTDAAGRFPRRRPWRVSDFTAAELSTLDAGAWFAAQLISSPAERQPWLRDLSAGERDTLMQPKDMAHFASGSVRIPSLAECLRLCRKLSLVAHVELKAIPRFYPRLADKAVAAIRDAGMERDVLVSSFDHQALARMAQLAPGVKLGVLTRDRIHRPSEYLARLGACAYIPCCTGEDDTIGFGAVTGQIDRDTIAEVKAAGFDVYVWTENDTDRMRRLVEAGVSGIYTDYPHRLRAVLGAGIPGRHGT